MQTLSLKLDLVQLIFYSAITFLKCDMGFVPKWARAKTKMFLDLKYCGFDSPRVFAEYVL